MGWAEANRFPFFRPVSIFNGAENRRVFHRFKPPRFSSSRASLFQRDDCSRGEGKLCTYIVYNYYWQFFGNDSNLRQERKKNSIKILIHVNSVDACRPEMSRSCHCLYCAGTIVVISHVSLPFALSVVLFLRSEKEFQRRAGSLRYFIPLLKRKFDWRRNRIFWNSKSFRYRGTYV